MTRIVTGHRGPSSATHGTLVAYQIAMTNPRPTYRGFIVIDTRTGDILSELVPRRGSATAALVDLVAAHGRREQEPDDVQYRSGLWYRPLGIHHVRLYPGQEYDRATYRAN